MEEVNFYKKTSEGVKFTPDFQKKHFVSCYGPLLRGPKLPNGILRQLGSIRFEPYSVIACPSVAYHSRLIAYVLARLGVTLYQTLYTHNLIEIFVDKVEGKYLSDIGLGFAVLVHGTIPTPNVRLLDLICEFAEYRINNRKPFILVHVGSLETKVHDFLKTRGIRITMLRTEKEEPVI